MTDKVHTVQVDILQMPDLVAMTDHINKTDPDMILKEITTKVDITDLNKVVITDRRADTTIDRNKADTTDLKVATTTDRNKADTIDLKVDLIVMPDLNVRLSSC